MTAPQPTLEPTRPTGRPARHPRGLRRAALALALATIAGCATTGPGAGGETPLADDFVRSRLIAADFADVIAQLPALDPAATVLTTPAPDSRFGELLFGALQDAGYDMRIGAAGADLGYSVARAGGADAEAGGGPGTYTFLVSAGPVKLKRDYAVDAAGIRPASTMLVHGADASAVVIDHARFERAARTPVAATVAASGPASGATSGPASVALAGGAGTAALRTAPRPAERAPSAPAPSVAPTPAAPRAKVVARAVPVVAPRPSAERVPEANLYETRRSAFAPLLAGHAPLDKRVMVFGNDSLVMGADNKRLAREIAERFDPATDLVSLIGCSHGPTALADGNRTLALGRAARVKEELVIAGIDPSLVLQEGCWAGTHYDKMPARGVVVTHRRRAD